MADMSVKFAPCDCSVEQEDWELVASVRTGAAGATYECETCGEVYRVLA